MKNESLFCLLVLLCSMGSMPLHGQGSDSTNLELKILSAEDMVLPAPTKKLELVTATRSGSRGLEDFPVTVYIIPKEEILLNGYTTLIDVLKSVPGIKTSKPGGALQGESFLMRGLLGNQYTKILIDGLPIQASVTGSMSIAENLPIAQAEKIEVIYGPAATIYGSDAMSGVVNIITRKIDHGVITQGSMVVGTDGYRHVNFMAGGKVGRNKNVLSYILYANMGKRDDMNIYHDNHAFNTFDYAFLNGGVYVDDEGYSLEDLEQIRKLPEVVSGDLYRQTGFPHYRGTGFEPEKGPLPETSYLMGATLNYRNLQFNYNESYRRGHSSLGRNPMLFSYAQSKYFIGERVQRAALSYNNRWNKISFTFNSSYLRYRTDEESSFGNNYFTGFGGQSYTYQASDDIFLESLLNYSPNDNWDLLLGASHQWSSNLPVTNGLATPFNPSDYRPFNDELSIELHPRYGMFGYNPISFSNSSFFIQGFYHQNNWSLLLGARFISAGNYESPGQEAEEALLLGNLSRQLLPRLGLLYKLSEVSSVRLSFAAGYRLPPSSKAFGSIALPIVEEDGSTSPTGVDYQQIPSQGVSPELSASLELGYRYLFSDKVYADATLYMNTVANRLNSRFVDVNLAQYPNADFNQTDEEGNLLRRARQWGNSSESVSQLLGLQLMFRARDIIPRYKLGADFFFNLSGGSETLPSGKKLEGYRAVPNHLLQMNFSLSPSKNVYIRLENIWSGSWLRRNLQSQEDFHSSYARVDGYFTTDITARYQFSKNLSGYVRVLNVFNTEYGGIGAEGLDIDLFYLPQLKRNIQIGLSFSK